MLLSRGGRCCDLVPGGGRGVGAVVQKGGEGGRCCCPEGVGVVTWSQEGG